MVMWRGAEVMKIVCKDHPKKSHPYCVRCLVVSRFKTGVYKGEN